MGLVFCRSCERLPGDAPLRDLSADLLKRACDLTGLGQQQPHKTQIGTGAVPILDNPRTGSPQALSNPTGLINLASDRRDKDSGPAVGRAV
jgi:hypothetical protein